MFLRKQLFARQTFSQDLTYIFWFATKAWKSFPLSSPSQIPCSKTHGPSRALLNSCSPSPLQPPLLFWTSPRRTPQGAGRRSPGSRYKPDCIPPATEDDGNESHQPQQALYLSTSKTKISTPGLWSCQRFDVYSQNRRSSTTGQYQSLVNSTGEAQTSSTCATMALWIISLNSAFHCKEASNSWNVTLS